ncbi:hypothetical protein J4447_04295 [Candidatus Pacearchaeota archaeon]|nr:hypothetical protein [Candidatus Pacearchaeota archaeon]
MCWKFGKKADKLLVLGVFLTVVISAYIVTANYYISDIFFVVPNTVYTTGEQIEFKGYVYEANYSDNGTIVTASSLKSGYSVNLTIRYRSNGTYVGNYTLTTDSGGAFYSNSTYHFNYTRIPAPSSEGEYRIRAQYIDGNSSIKYSEVEIRVVSQTIDSIKISPDKSTYNPSETVKVIITAASILSDKANYVSNVTINGSLRNNTKGIVQSFNCTTGSDGKCSFGITAPSSYGSYFLETNNFKSYSSFSVIPFTANVYMKDELGKSYKNTFALGEQASVEVNAVENSTTAVYNFSGYIADSRGNVVQTINSTTLTSNNSFTNKFVFTVSSLSFSYGTYYAIVTITKEGDGNRTETSSFEVKDWKLTFSKKSVGSGFEYEYSTFSNKTLYFEAYPRYRSNASVVPAINATSFSANLTDNLNNNILTANVTWNSSCGTEGCYQFSFRAPTTSGSYTFKLTLSNGGDTQVASRTINVIDKVMQAQSTDSEGNIKELFGASDAVYITISAYNQTATQINLSDIELFSVTYMNGTAMSYTNKSSFSLVNTTNSVLEWAVNHTAGTQAQVAQRIKMDVPKFGGVYDLYIFAENRTVAGFARFIVNPYDICVSAKNTPGQVSGSSGYYYIYQFKTTDIVYFEIKAIQANNPLGKASVSNFSSNASNGMGSACSINTQTQQAVNNATLSVVSAKNTQNGATYALNETSSVCVSSDSSGGYTCTVQAANKWDGGTYSVLIKATGPDGQTQDDFYGFFEARSFYIYGWSQTWQNRPASNITLTVQMYEAGRGWWGSYGSGGLSGTVSVERVEYQGRDGEWVWPPINYPYNNSMVNSTSITTGQGTITLPAQYAPEGNWKTGYYRVILKGTDSNGNSDYGYAWFGVKRWNAYGSPIQCSTSGCYYKSYFNSKENITLYVQISNAGDWSYSYGGGESLGGNITIGVKKIQDCKSWPCKDLNSSQFVSNTIAVNQSNQWYWGSSAANQSTNYTLRINRTSGTWGTGYYNVVLDVNGTETGYAWFNTIAFYVDTRPTNVSGDNNYWHYEIKNNEPRYYNITTVKSYKGWGSSYNASDYLNTTITNASLRYWDDTTYQNKELVYLRDFNITPSQINGTAKVNITYGGGNWPSGWYWGEIVLNGSDGDTSTGWMYFSVKPFRISISTSSYQIGRSDCINTTLYVYEPSWASSTLLNSNYTIQRVYEDVWTGMSSSRTAYTNYSNSSFRNQTNFQLCPNPATGKWSSGSWGGYHYLNVVVNDTQNNLTQNGWISFRTVPFSITWGSVSGGNSKKTNENFNVSVNLYGGTNTSRVEQGNLTKIYQWRSGGSGGGWSSSKEEYNFTVQANSTNGISTCNSWTSGACKVNGSTTISIYAPSTGWTVGSNYLYAEWTEVDDTAVLQDWYGIYIDARELYNGYYSNVDENGNWKYYFAPNDNLTIRLYVRNVSYGNVAANITNVEYSAPSSNCWDEWCRTYTSATWSLVGGGSQVSNNTGGIIKISRGASNWTKGEYRIKVSVSGSEGSATIKGGYMQVKDFTPPNVTLSSPTINSTFTGNNFSVSATTSKTATCNLYLTDYDRFRAWNSCVNATESANGTTLNGLIESCNYTKYNFNGSYYKYDYVSRDYRSVSSGPNYTYWYQYGTTGFSTDSTTHTYTFNTTDPTNNAPLTAQHYALQVSCWDRDWNTGSAYAAFKINVTS